VQLHFYVRSEKHLLALSVSLGSNTSFMKISHFPNLELSPN